MKKLTTTLLLTTILALQGCKGPAQSSIDGPSTLSEANIESRAAKILSKMTLEEKIGQVIQADISAVSPEDLKTYNLGSVLNGGNSAPGGGVTAKPEEWVALADAFWSASTDVSDGGVGVPAIWGTDAVHGHNNLQNATMFPHNSALGAMHNPELMEKIGEITAREIRATGLDWTFAPTLAVALDDKWGRAYESYSENPDLVAKYASAIVEGLQGKPGSDGFLKGDNVMATAKHFIADGGTQLGIDKGDTLGDMDEIIKVHGAGYGPAFDKGVQVVMASFSSINGEKMHGHEYLLNDVLRGKMGFDGFVVGDWNGHGEVPGCSNTDCPESLLAGVDMYMAPDSWKGIYDSLLKEANDGKLDMARLDEAVTRILEVKIRSGLLDAGLPSKRASTNLDHLGSAEHTAIARQAVRESLVLLKNNGTLPIKSNASILVTGSGADSMQQQTGGWTLSWQGDSNSNDVFETGESIYSGIRKAVEADGGSAILSVDGQFDEKPDVAIVVFGEQPYAEYRGDRSDLVFEFDGGENLSLIKSLKDQGIPVVTIFLTGRPLWVNPHLNISDSFVVGWLPGTEGGGIADVIIGDSNGSPRNNFKGKLSFSWPSDGTGKPINSKDDDGILYPFGFGLNYGSKNEFETLSLDPGVSSIGAKFDGNILSRGDASGPFDMYVGDSSNWNIPVMALLANSLGNGIKIKGVDYKEQEDARSVNWSGNGRAVLDVKTQRPIDLTDIGPSSGYALKIDWRIDEMPKDLSVGMGCGDGCGAVLSVEKFIDTNNTGKWIKTEIPVSCFEAKGMNTESVNKILSISANGSGSVTLYNAEISEASATASCPN